MSNITLRRAAEYARVALDRLLYCEKSCNCFGRDAITALDAALAEPPAKPEPATDEQIVKAGGECAVVDNEYLLDFRDGFRAAERFHGIRGSKT
jgi:hypothetical protein